MKRVYLDTNHWIGLSKAMEGAPGPYRDALDVIQYAADNDLASFPVSSIHYIEINTKGKPEPRLQAGAAIAAISKQHSIAPLSKVLAWELDVALADLLDLPAPEPLRVFGQGYAHAFGQPNRKVKLEGPAGLLPAGEKVRLEQVAQDFLERTIIGGPPFRLPAQGIAAPDRSFAEKFAAEQQVLADKLEVWGRNNDHAEKLAMATEYVDIIDVLNDRLIGADVDPRKFAEMGRDLLRGFLQQLPVRWTGCQLRRVAFRAGRKWQRNDMNDIGALSLASVHCDVVVFEKHWASMYRETKLDQKAVVLSKISDLAAVLVA